MDDSIFELLNEHTIVDVDDYVHVIDGKVVCYESDVIDFKNYEQVHNIMNALDRYFDESNPSLKSMFGVGKTRLIISGNKCDAIKDLGMGSIDDLPDEILEKVRCVVDENKK